MPAAKLTSRVFAAVLGVLACLVVPALGGAAPSPAARAEASSLTATVAYAVDGTRCGSAKPTGTSHTCD